MTAFGQRGTDQLGPDRKPSQKMTRRGQPYRKKKRHGRPQGPTLTAMLKGSPAFLPNPMDIRRQAQKSVAEEHRPYFAQLKRHDRDSLPSEQDAVRQTVDSPGWRVITELIEQAHANATRRLLFTHTGSTGRVLEQAEYARLLGFLAGIDQARVAAEAFLMYAERVREKEE